MEYIMKTQAALLMAMANPVRLEILQLLVENEIDVTSISNHLGMSQSAVSQHLAKLRAEKLVNTRRDAQTVFYSSTSSSVKTILAALAEIGETERPHQEAGKQAV
jgi:DNA-binding transcriptional ArsR family regulator